MGIRDWLETKHWYWFSLKLDFTPFPWHWQCEWTNYRWGVRGLFGPVGFFIIWPDGSKASGDYPRGRK